MTDQPRTLTQMQYRDTAYEVVAYADGAPMRLGFTAQRNKHVLLRFAQRHADVLSPFAPDDVPCTYKAGAWQLGPRLRITYSGRTERDCATEEGRI